MTSAGGRGRTRRPSQSVLYRWVQQHLETWLAQCRDGHDDEWSVPEHVERAFRRYLECGILAHGFARARCGQCGRDFLQRDAHLQGAALRLLLRVVEQCLRAHSPGSSSAARLGAVAVIHRFGSSPNAHLHFHCVVIDGVFDAAAAGGVVFHAATELDADAIADVQACVRRRLLRVFVRRGLLPGDDARAMAQWQHGGGFSADGSVRLEATDCAGREWLLRYCARPPLALERLRELDPERLVYGLRPSCVTGAHVGGRESPAHHRKTPPHSGAQPSHLPGGSVASTCDRPIR